MRRAHTVEQVRAAEQELMARLPEGMLMARAASGLATAVLDLLGSAYGRRVRLLIGSGDNGGDALYAGALLARRGVRVEAVLLGSTPHQAGLAAYRRAGGVTTTGRARPDLVVDGIVGIGRRPGLRDDAVAALAEVAGVPVLAVDVPSGVSVDDGRLDGPHVTADVTVTFGTLKIAHLVDPAAQACGVVQLVDIGLDDHLPEPQVESLQAEDVARLVPRPGFEDQKYTRGVVGVRAGSTEYPGAGLLSVSAAGCGLAGMVRYDGEIADLVREQHPEVVANDGRVQAWVVGSGGGADVDKALRKSLDAGVPLVLDADVLAHLDGPVGHPAVLTPHAGELSKMLGVERAEVEAGGLRYVREAADRYQAVVLLKGSHTLVAHPDGRVRANTTGTPWLATAGAGDVLGGLVGALLAAGLPPYDAASVGAWLHGAAATLASGSHGRQGPIVAGEVAKAIPAVVRGLPTVT